MVRGSAFSLSWRDIHPEGGCTETCMRAPMEGGDHEHLASRMAIVSLLMIVSGEFFRTHPVSGP